MIKINILDAIREYEDEQARLTEEMMEQEAQASQTVTPESDPLWDCWYHFAATYEPKTGKYDEPKAAKIGKTDKIKQDASEKPEDYEPFWKFDDGIWYVNPFAYETIYVSNEQKPSRMSVPKRRRATAMHKRKIRRNVTAIWGNYANREEEDMRNWSYKKLKDGDRVICPKSQIEKADMFFKKAMKINALPKALHDTIVKHLEWISQYCKRNIGGRLMIERNYRETEEKVKRELDEMAKANINPFTPLSDYRYVNGKWILKEKVA